jgi:hypothetical protein
LGWIETTFPSSTFSLAKMFIHQTFLAYHFSYIFHHLWLGNVGTYHPQCEKGKRENEGDRETLYLKINQNKNFLILGFCFA